MPELPEVEALRTFLANTCVGRTIARTELVAFASLKTFEVPLSALHGLEVDGVQRRGKFICLSVGGLYGMSLGGLFAGESMFHDPEHGRDASKVALLALVGMLSDEHAEERIIDVQWQTDHLATLGVIEVERDEYLGLLAEALSVPEPAWPVREEDHA